MKQLLKKAILNSPVEPVIRSLLNKPKIDVPFEGSANYWEERYVSGGNSGAGSYGHWADFKAEVLNDFVQKQEIHTVIEFGCGDGNQLTLAQYPQYTGVDVSSKAIDLCNLKFKKDQTKSFVTNADYSGESADLSLSLDVIYHLVEDQVYEEYMNMLFKAGKRFVIVYSSDHDSPEGRHAEHVRSRKFTPWVAEHAPEFKLIDQIKNTYQTSDNGESIQDFHADFFIFERQS